ncbi:MAG: hypothetical protein VXW32_16500 [Myxococcota bacterium]|nr:hypothetical protein [Myxococcota bacterium]
MHWFFRLLPLLLASTAASAHPVTFTGGFAASSIHRPGMTHSQMNYTLHRKLAVGATHLRLRYLETPLEGSLGQMNVLLLRRNRSHSQANLYVSLGAGVVHEGIRFGAPLFLGGVQADFETDNFYTALMAMTAGTPDLFESPDALPVSVRSRIGLLPFDSGFEALQAWAVVQVDYQRLHEDPWSTTPLLRFFYRNVLWEFGASLDGKPWLHLMFHI